MKNWYKVLAAAIVLALTLCLCLGALAEAEGEDAPSVPAVEEQEPAEEGGEVENPTDFDGPKPDSDETSKPVESPDPVPTAAPHQHFAKGMTVEIVEPTCTDPGRTWYVCNEPYCTYKIEGEYISPKGHGNGGWEWKTITPSTCTTQGLEYHVCLDCWARGVVFYDDSRAANVLPHEFGEYEVQIPATCTQEGYRTRACKNCGYVDPQDPNQYMAPLGHTPNLTRGKIYVDPAKQSCYWYECARCRVAVYVENGAVVEGVWHNWSKWIVTQKQTCHLPEKAYRYCLDCGETVKETREIPANGEHEWHEQPEKEIPGTCQARGYKFFYCAKCGEEKVERTAKNPNLHKEQVKELGNGGIVDTSTWTSYIASSSDGLVTEVEYNGKRWEAKKPTCTEGGFEWEYCTKCNTVVTAPHIVPALGHAWKVNTEATCDTDADVVCTRCGATPDEATKAANGWKAHHIFGDLNDWYRQSYADCETWGVIIRTCLRPTCPFAADGYRVPIGGTPKATTACPDPACADLNPDYPDPLGQGHHWKLYDGADSGANPDPEQTEDDVTGKDDNDRAYPATCTQRGVIRYICEICGQMRKEEVAPLDHKNPDGTPAIAFIPESHILWPTCENAGNLSGYVCALCGKIVDYQFDKAYMDQFFKDATKNGKQVFANGADPMGHAYVLTDVVKASCEEEGYWQWTCKNMNYNTGKVCNDAYYVTTPARGHLTVFTQNIDPECEKDGLRTGYCVFCGEQQVEIIPATGHTMGAWTVTKPAECEVAGEKTATCTVCGKVVTEAIPATGHDWDEGRVVVKPTTETEGTIIYTCKNNKAHVKSEKIPKLEPEPTEAPTEKPADPTEAPADPTEVPVDPTEVPADPTDKPADPTDKPADPTAKPADPTSAPVNPVNPAPAVELKNGAIDIEGLAATELDAQSKLPGNAAVIDLTKDGEYTYKVFADDVVVGELKAVVKEGKLTLTLTPAASVVVNVDKINAYKSLDAFAFGIADEVKLNEEADLGSEYVIIDLEGTANYFSNANLAKFAADEAVLAAMRELIK